MCGAVHAAVNCVLCCSPAQSERPWDGAGAAPVCLQRALPAPLPVEFNSMQLHSCLRPSQQTSLNSHRQSQPDHRNQQPLTDPGRPQQTYIRLKFVAGI